MSRLPELPLLTAGRRNLAPGQFDLQGEFFQASRLVDVFLLGPFMVWYAASTTEAPDWARFLLAVSGLMTIGFNLRNFVLVERARTR